MIDNGLNGLNGFLIGISESVKSVQSVVDIMVRRSVA